MTVVVCAGFDPGLDAAVLSRVTALRAAGLRVSVPRHPPHLTLGAADVPPSALDEIRVLIAALAERVPPFDVRLDYLGAFPGGILWLGPQPSAELSGLQTALDVALLDAGHPRAFGAQSDPRHWVAHCTLARRLSPAVLGNAVTRLAAGLWPLRGKVERLLTILLRHPGSGESIPLGGRDVAHR